MNDSFVLMSLYIAALPVAGLVGCFIAALTAGYFPGIERRDMVARSLFIWIVLWLFVSGWYNRVSTGPELFILIATMVIFVALINSAWSYSSSDRKRCVSRFRR
jgi:hypothetical protein